ncbi:MAG: TIM barrel protein [Firmicutes bacterium]|nr:TIM barrel protein [Bacillota bacterium]
MVAEQSPRGSRAPGTAAGPSGAGGLVFGTGGVPKSAPKRSSDAGLRRLVELGLGAMELEFVHRVAMGERAATALGALRAELGLWLTAHAPYYINLNSKDPKIVKASGERLLQAARIGWVAGATDVAFHCGYYHDDPPEEVFGRVRSSLEEIAGTLRAEGNGVTLRPETTGAPASFGTLKEVVELSVLTDGVMPCLDFSHLHARSGGKLDLAGFSRVLEFVRERLGEAALSRLHTHVSGIQHKAGAEEKHIELEASDMPWRELLRALKQHGAGGVVICESPNLESDALTMKHFFETL